jgi:hypothetical protein
MALANIVKKRVKPLKKRGLSRTLDEQCLENYIFYLPSYIRAFILNFHASGMS